MAALRAPDEPRRFQPGVRLLSGRVLDAMGHNTCVLDGRVFSCAPRCGRLVLREILVGDTLAVLELDLGVAVDIDWVRYVSLCPCDGRLLAVVLDGEPFALSIELRGPGLTSEGMGVRRLPVEAEEFFYLSWVCMTQLSPGFLLLHTYEDPQDYALDVFPDRARIRDLVRPGDADVYRVGPAIRLSSTEAATLVEMHKRSYLAILRVEGQQASYRLFPLRGLFQQLSTSLLAIGRFVLAYGGYSDSLGEHKSMFVWDTASGRASWAKPEGGWPFRCWLPFMLRQGDTLLVVRGRGEPPSFLVSLGTVADCLREPRVRRDFKAALLAEKGEIYRYSTADLAVAFRARNTVGSSAPLPVPL